MILIQKFIKHNYLNDLYCNIKYLDLHLSLNFPILFLFIVNFSTFSIELSQSHDLEHIIDM